MSLPVCKEIGKNRSFQNANTYENFTENNGEWLANGV